MARLNYAPRVFGGRVTLFWASKDLRGSFDLVEGWRILAGGGIDVHEVSGNHLNLIKEPWVTELAGKLQNCLERACAQVTNKLDESARTSLTNDPNHEASSYQQMKKAS